jgi:hypothetical protein
MTQHRFPALSGLEDHPIRAYLTSILSGIADLPISRTAQVTPLLGRLAPNPRYSERGITAVKPVLQETVTFYH